MNDEPTMNMHTVSFSVEVEATDPTDAARTFWDVVRDYMGGLGDGRFTVRDSDGLRSSITLTAEELTSDLLATDYELERREP